MTKSAFNSKLLVFFSITICISIIVYLNYYFVDGVSGEIATFIFGDDAEYSPEYSEKGFKKIRIGMTEKDVLSALGIPLKKGYFEWNGVYSYIYFEMNHDSGSGSVDYVSKHHQKKVKKSNSEADVLRILGPPKLIVWYYSRPKNSRNYKNRLIKFKKGKVWQIFHEYYWD